MSTGGWRLAPGVVRLSQSRLAGGYPYRVIRLSPAGDAALSALLGSCEPVVAGSAAARLGDRLVRYGLLMGPARAAVEVCDVTVVMPALADPSSVAAALRSVPAQVPVVLVDDGCPVPLSEMLEGRQGLVHVRHPTPRGPAAARNAGARLARTRWIAFLDTDVRPSPGWLGLLLAHAQGDGVVAVAPRVCSAPSAGVAGLVESYAGALDMGEVAAEVVVGGRVSYVPSAALLVDRGAFERIGGFDPSLAVGEDVDLIWRLGAVGRVRYEPGVTVLHVPRTDLGAVMRRRYLYGTSAALLDERHPGVLRHADVSVWSVLPWVVGILVRPWVGVLAAVGVAVAAPWRVRMVPAREAVRLVARLEVASQLRLGRWLLRPLLPLSAAGVLVVPRWRRCLGFGVAVGCLDIVRRSASEQRTLRGTARGALAHLLDDLAYSAGVWQGCLTRRRFGPLGTRVRRPERAGSARQAVE
jgi:mycofactocin system glycosyltransferase